MRYFECWTIGLLRYGMIYWSYCYCKTHNISQNTVPVLASFHDQPPDALSSKCPSIYADQNACVIKYFSPALTKAWGTSAYLFYGSHQFLAIVEHAQTIGKQLFVNRIFHEPRSTNDGAWTTMHRATVFGTNDYHPTKLVASGPAMVLTSFKQLLRSKRYILAQCLTVISPLASIVTTPYHLIAEILRNTLSYHCIFGNTGSKSAFKARSKCRRHP